MPLAVVSVSISPLPFLLPNSVVENTGFRKLLTVTAPCYRVPSHMHFSRTVGPNLYCDVKAKVRKSLLSMEGDVVHCTTDIWTSWGFQTGSYNFVQLQIKIKRDIGPFPPCPSSVPVTPVREKVQIHKSTHLQNGKELLCSCNKASQQLTQNQPTSPRPAPARPH